MSDALDLVSPDEMTQVLELQTRLAIAEARARTLDGSLELYRTALFAVLKLLEFQFTHGVEP